MKLLLFSLLLHFSSFYIQAQSAQNYIINIEFFPSDAKMWNYPVANDAFMRGNSQVKLSEINTDSLFFYLHGELKVDSIISNHQRIEYNSNKVLYDYSFNMVALKTTFDASKLESTSHIDIYYSGFFNPSKARSLSDYMHINKNKGVYLRSYGYSLWFPIFIEPEQDSYSASFEKITVKTPENLKTIVTGELLNETLENGIITTVWKPGTLNITDLQCTAREYNVLTRENISVYYTQAPDKANKILEFTKELKNIFNKNLKEINKSSSLFIIEMPKYGNISSQNVIGISEDVYNDFENNLYSKLTIAHELVHPYTLIPTSKDNPFAALVVEGFPSFFHLYGLKKTTLNQDFELKEYMEQVEKNYLKKKETGKDRRGNKLPVEKPILKISYDEIGDYKDRFVLSDRVRLFLYQLWTTMGNQDFDKFLKELFDFRSIDYESFEKLIVKYIPNYNEKLNLWLHTSEYPKSIRINSD